MSRIWIPRDPAYDENKDLRLGVVKEATAKDGPSFKGIVDSEAGARNDVFVRQYPAVTP